jgi:hypothetical protein
MTHPNARRLLLLAALSLPGMAGAQTIPIPASPPGSHRPLDGLLPNSDAAAQAMADRLQRLHDSRQLRDLAEKLLQDPALLRKLQEGFDPAELSKLRDKLQHGEALGNDPELKKKLLETAQQLPGIDPEQAEALKRWAERAPDPTPAPPPPPPGSPAPQPKPPGATPPPPPPVMSGPRPNPPTPAPTSTWDRLQQKSQSWFNDNVAGKLDKFVHDFALSQDGDSLRQALRSLGNRDAGLPLGLAERIRGLSDTLAGLKDRLPAGMSPTDFRALFEKVRLPDVPRFKKPSFDVDFAGPGDGVGPWWLLLVVLAALGLALHKTAAARRAARGADGGWRLGPWPVAPAAVATRGELVAAFEYLAVLCLGPDARARNHLDLAKRLAQGPDEAGRRRAAGELARLYEQARYAPDAEPLTPDDVAAARRDLCLLAGVAAA